MGRREYDEMYRNVQMVIFDILAFSPSPYIKMELFFSGFEKSSEEPYDPAQNTNSFDKITWRLSFLLDFQISYQLTDFY